MLTKLRMPRFQPTRTILLAIVVLILNSSALLAQKEPQKPTAKQPAAAQEPKVTRADLGRSYMRMDQKYAAAAPVGELRAKINAGFDAATQHFFTGSFANALRSIDELLTDLEESPAGHEFRVALALRGVVDPPVIVAGSGTQPKLHVESLYDLELDSAGQFPFKLQAGRPGEPPLFELPLEVEAGVDLLSSQTLELPASVASFKPGTYEFTLVSDDDSFQLPLARLSVVPESLDAVRKSNESKLAAMKFDDPTLAQALAACRARNELLADTPSDTNSAQFLSDPLQLSADVAAEIEALAAGRDPYRGRLGDYWRVMEVKGKQIPLAVYAPEAAQGEKPLPLFIALHGMGADENMFLAAYGAGRIKKLADEQGFVVASPSTYSFGGKPEHVAALVDLMAAEYPIDRSRVYVIGHSLGAAAAATLASKAQDQLAAACCLAGGRSFGGRDGCVPTLVIAAELDAIVPAAGVEGGAKKASEAGLPVELRTMQGYAHTLMVGDALADAVPWLMEHQKKDANPSSAATVN